MLYDSKCFFDSKVDHSPRDSSLKIRGYRIIFKFKILFFIKTLYKIFELRRFQLNLIQPFHGTEDLSKDFLTLYQILNILWKNIVSCSTGIKLNILLNFSSCEKLLFCLLRGLWKMKGIRGENFLSAWVVYCYPTEVFRNFWKFFTPEKRLNRPEKPLFKQIWPKIEAQISRW